MSGYLQRLVRPAGSAAATRTTGLQEIEAVELVSASREPAAREAPPAPAAIAPAEGQPSLDTVRRWVAGPSAQNKADAPHPSRPAHGGAPSLASPPPARAVHPAAPDAPQHGGVGDGAPTAGPVSPVTRDPAPPVVAVTPAPAPAPGLGPSDHEPRHAVGDRHVPAYPVAAHLRPNARPSLAEPRPAASRPAASITPPAGASGPVSVHIGTVELRVQAPAPAMAPVIAPTATPAPVPAARLRQSAPDPLPFHPARHHLRWN